MSNVQNVFLVGAKSLGAYGGYETFVYKLTEYHQNNPNIKYHVACKANGDGYMDETKLDNVKRISDTEFEFHNARCFKIHIPQIGAAQAIYYDVAALRECCKYIKKNNIEKPIVYIMACRIGPFEIICCSNNSHVFMDIVGDNNLSHCAYFGDDIIDINCMQPIKDAGGIVGCPADAVREVKQLSDYVCINKAGEGALREFTEWLITEKRDVRDIKRRVDAAVNYLQSIDVSLKDIGKKIKVRVI